MIHFLAGLLHVINVAAIALLAGGSVMILLVVIPGRRRFELPLSVLVHQTCFDLKKDSYMRGAGVVAVLTTIGILIWHRNFTPAIAALYGLGLVCTLAFIVLVQRIAIPIHQRILTWNAAAPPPEYVEVRDRFDRTHAVRTALAVLALVCFSIAGVASR